MNHLSHLFQKINSAVIKVEDSVSFAALPRGLVWAFAVVAFLGFVDATYLTVQHFLNAAPPCVFGNCELVLTSKYSSILGVPTALWGAIYYFSILVLTLLYIDTKKNIFFIKALGLTCVGLVMSLWFLYLQMFVIHAYCQYCLISGGTSLTLFILAMVIYKKYLTVKKTVDYI